MKWFFRILAAGLVIAAGLSLLLPRPPSAARLIASGAPAAPADPEPPLGRAEGPWDNQPHTDDNSAVFSPEAEEPDHNEQADREEFLSAFSGEGGGIIRGRTDPRASGVHISNPGPWWGGRQPGHAEGVYDATGSGRSQESGGGGRYGGRLGGRRNLTAHGGTRKCLSRDEAILAGLGWLARHQDATGRWSSAGFEAVHTDKGCTAPGYAENDEGVTALAVLAFLRAGYTPLCRTELRDPFGGSWQAGTVVGKALSWLTGQQRPDGEIGFDRDDWFVIRHAAATWALCEAAGLTGDDALRQSARRAVERLLELQEPYSGWGDSGRRQKVDLVATAWACRALAAAENAGLPFPQQSREGIANFLEAARVSKPFGALSAGYEADGDGGKVFFQGKNEDWDGHPLGAAVSLFAFPRCRSQLKETDRLFAVALVSDLPEFGGKKIDYHAWNFAAAALLSRRFEFPKHFAAFREAALNALLPTQRTVRDGCPCGSWDVDVDRWGFVGGRVYATAMNVLTLLDLGE